MADKRDENKGGFYTDLAIISDHLATSISKLFKVGIRCADD